MTTPAPSAQAHAQLTHTRRALIEPTSALPLYADAVAALGHDPGAKPVDDPDVALAAGVHQLLSAVDRIDNAGLLPALDTARARGLLGELTSVVDRLTAAVGASA